MASIFTRIVAGEIPAATVYEDEHTLAFLDINPASRGHTLVIIKEERPGLLDLTPEQAAAVTRTTQLVARALVAVLQPDGFNIVQNNGEVAGQTVMHYHVHIIPRWSGDRVLQHWHPGNAQPAELQTLAATIAAAVTKGEA
jgi:histidine triad (HIT) family protein